MFGSVVVLDCVAVPLCPFTKVQWRESPEAWKPAVKEEWLQNSWFVCLFWALRRSGLIMFPFGFGY